MHELALARSLAEEIFKYTEENKKGPKQITIVIGKASGVEKEFLEHSLRDHIFKGTKFENVKFEFLYEMPKIKCKVCSREFKDVVIKCECGGDNFEIVSGKDVYIKEIETFE
ncbi:MAG: hydrogenase maturation nickel metallochaperone HypA [Endomicrobia bacterium]|nr:hydrogenase maturation nickel metallochaperone HypA [Endomicrobiia bacterium]